MGPIPPPCPVDDAPHTTCTSPDYVPTAPIVIVQLPCRDASLAAEAAPAAAPAEALPPSFTTKTYAGQLKRRGRG
jgi:hypothetical protein